MNRNLWLSRIWRLTVLGLVVTGFAQMPIFKRYYVADVPGFGWLANFTLNHTLHLALGTVFVALAAYFAAMAVGRRVRLTRPAVARAAVVAVLAASGVLRAVMDLDWVVFTQNWFIVADLIHLGATMAWGGLELAFLMVRRGGGKTPVGSHGRVPGPAGRQPLPLGRFRTK